MCIDVVLSTFNGEKYLAELLDSVLLQRAVDFRILVRDDGSTDGTKDILRHYVEKYPQKICFVDDCERLGVRGSFSRLSLLSNALYVAFADQDDYWHPDKLRLTLDRLQEGEKQYGKDSPLLAHCDLRVVDVQMRPLADSFWRYQKLDVQINSLRRLLVSNTVTGCAAMVNRALVNIAMPMPESDILHDYWLAMVASCFGKVLPVDRTLIDYRQHQNNAVGARSASVASILKMIFRGEFKKNYTVAAKSAGFLLARYADRLSVQDRAMLKAFSNIQGSGVVGRRCILLKHRIGFSMWWKDFILFLRA